MSTQGPACLRRLVASEVRFDRQVQEDRAPPLVARPRPSARDATFIVSGSGDKFAARQQAVVTMLVDAGIRAPIIVTLPREHTDCRYLSPCRRQWERCAMHPARGYTLRHRMSSHGFVNYLTHVAIAHEVVRRNISFALIVEDDAALSFPARRTLSRRGLLHVVDALAHSSLGFSVMYVGGGQAMHAPPTWSEVAQVAVPRGNTSFRAFRAPPLKSPATRFSHGYVLSVQGARLWLEQAPQATQQIDRHHEVLHQQNRGWTVDFVEPPLLCQTHRHVEHRNFTNVVDPDCPRIPGARYEN